MSLDGVKNAGTSAPPVPAVMTLAVDVDWRGRDLPFCFGRRAQPLVFSPSGRARPFGWQIWNNPDERNH